VAKQLTVFYHHIGDETEFMEMVGIANAKNEEIYWLVLKRLKTVKRK